MVRETAGASSCSTQLLILDIACVKYMCFSLGGLEQV